MRGLGEPAPPTDVVTYEDYTGYVESLPPAIAKHLHKRIVHTEEEAVSYARAEETPLECPGHGVILLEEPGGNVPTRGIYISERTIQVAMHYSLPVLCCSLVCSLQHWVGGPPLPIDKVITLDDHEGVIQCCSSCPSCAGICSFGGC